MDMLSETILESHTAYVIFEARSGVEEVSEGEAYMRAGEPGIFDWGIFVTSVAPAGQYYRAIRKPSGWELEFSQVHNITATIAHVVLVKVDVVSSHQVVDAVIRRVSNETLPNNRSRQPSVGRTWVVDCLIELYNAEAAKIPIQLETFIGGGIRYASEVAPYNEHTATITAWNPLTLENGASLDSLNFEGDGVTDSEENGDGSEHV